MEAFLQLVDARTYSSPEAVAARKAEHARESEALDRKLIGVIDRRETKRIYDPAFRRAWDHKHPGTIGACTCRGHRLYRKEIAPGADD
jgi:hypothetical protein